MELVQKIKNFIAGHFSLMLTLFVVLGFAFHQFFAIFANHAEYFLMLVLFISFLKVKLADFLELKKDWKKVLFIVFVNNILLPLGLLLSFAFIDISYDFQIALFLILAISGGMSVGMIAGLMNLKILWGLVFAVFTSLLLPLTLPFLMFLGFGENLDISADFSLNFLFLFLLKMIVGPLLLSFLFFSKRLTKPKERLIKNSGVIGVLSISMMIAVLVSKNHQIIAENILSLYALKVTIILIFLFLLKFVVGFLIPAEKSVDRWTNSLLLGTNNNGLSIIIAAKFFSLTVFLITLLSEIPWILAQSIFPYLKNKFYKK